jgi:hypothetical protein
LIRVGWGTTPTSYEWRPRYFPEVDATVRLPSVT